ncbi:Beta-phenylalanine transaminase [Paramyrothecium foliicola]|nr:Beta-phenylalanine transaminase [Paramyrothecium foliicola]
MVLITDQDRALQHALKDATSRYHDRHVRSRELHEQAVKSLPGGNTRTVLHTGPFPVSIKSASGYQVFSEDGDVYTDLLGEFSAALYGHSHPVLLSVIDETIRTVGMNLGGTTAQEQLFAREICDRFDVERIRFANSGTEANLHALAAAKLFTGKNKTVVFAGGYHGGVLGFAGGRPAKNNVDKDDWVVVEYNDLQGARDAIRSEGVAAVLLEAMQGAGGGICGNPEFLLGVQQAASEAGVLVILDEVMTSRLSRKGLGDSLGLKPDLKTLGKYLGGGLAFGAFGGRQDVMAAFDPRAQGCLAHSGTFNNNSLAMRAGHAGLTRIYTEDAAEAFTEAGNRLRGRLNKETEGTMLCFTGHGSIMSSHFIKGGTREIQNWGSIEEEQALKDLFWFEMLEKGFWMAKRGFIALVLGTPESELDRFVNAVKDFVAKHHELVVAPPVGAGGGTFNWSWNFFIVCHLVSSVALPSEIMDYQNRAGSKFGGGGVASQSATNADRRERLRKLALESIDLDKDPYFFKNHVGSFECRLCLTVHQNDGSYLAHTQGKKHQTNLARRAAREQKEGKQNVDPATGLPVGITGAGLGARKNIVKIGRPGYKITKIRDPVSRQQGLLFQLQYPDATPETDPKWQVMNAFTQRVEEPDRNFQYFLVAAEPYETVGFKIPARELDKREDKQFSFWDPDAKEFWVQVMFMTEREEKFNAAPGLAARR